MKKIKINFKKNPSLIIKLNYIENFLEAHKYKYNYSLGN